MQYSIHTFGTTGLYTQDYSMYMNVQNGETHSPQSGFNYEKYTNAVGNDVRRNMNQKQKNLYTSIAVLTMVLILICSVECVLTHNVISAMQTQLYEVRRFK